MPEGQIFPVSDTMARSAWVDAAKYQAMYERSIKDPEGFWAEHGKRIDWIKPYTKVKDVSFTGDVHIRWFYDGTLNVVGQLHRPAPGQARRTRPPSSGKATTRRSTATSPTASCTSRCAGSPTC